jgi:hypothetical protein
VGTHYFFFFFFFHLLCEAAAAHAEVRRGKRRQQRQQQQQQRRRRRAAAAASAFPRVSPFFFPHVAFLNNTDSNNNNNIASAFTDLPMSDSPSGVLQAVLRLSAHDTDKQRSLVRAYKQLDDRYPGERFSVCLTANVTLKHTQKSTFKLYFGQSFGRAKSIFAGQRRDVEGKSDRLFKEYSVSSVMEAKALPTQFSKEEFGALFAQNFENSSVVVHSVVNLIYIFGLGLNNFVHDSKVGASLTTFW